MKKLVPIAAVAFVLFYTVSAPDDAAGVVHSTVALLGTVAGGLANFVTVAT
nr:hypothetical protein [Micromonospora sp. DSM 115978]